MAVVCPVTVRWLLGILLHALLVAGVSSELNSQLLACPDTENGGVCDYILVISPYERGHLNPVLDLAKQLKSTGEKVVVSCPTLKDADVLSSVQGEGLDVFDGGKVTARSSDLHQFSVYSQQPSHYPGAVYWWAALMSEANVVIYQSIQSFASAHPPSVIVFDMYFLPVATDLLALSPQSIAIMVNPFFSDILSLQSITTYAASAYDSPFDLGVAGQATFGQRLSLLTFRLFSSVAKRIIYSYVFNRDRLAAGLPAFDWNVEQQMHDKKIICFVSSAPPMDLPRPMHPGVFMLGPFVFVPPSDASSPLSPLLSALSPSLKSWLDDVQVANHSLVYISMGSVGMLTRDQLIKLLDGLILLFDHYDSHQRSSSMPSGLRVLWARGDAVFAAHNVSLPARFLSSTAASLFRLEGFVPQKSILAHPVMASSGVYINHCGMGSMHESLFFAVPSLAFPLFGDQIQVANRAVHTGAAILVDKHAFSSSELSEKLQMLLSNNSYRQSAREVSLYFSLAGGLSQADKIVKTMKKIQSTATKDHFHSVFVPFDANLTWFARRSWDSISFLVLLSITLGWCTLRLLGGFCGLCRSAPAHRTVRRKIE